MVEVTVNLYGNKILCSAVILRVDSLRRDEWLRILEKVGASPQISSQWMTSTSQKFLCQIVLRNANSSKKQRMFLHYSWREPLCSNEGIMTCPPDFFPWYLWVCLSSIYLQYVTGKQRWFNLHCGSSRLHVEGPPIQWRVCYFVICLSQIAINSQFTFLATRLRSQFVNYRWFQSHERVVPGLSFHSNCR